MVERILVPLDGSPWAEAVLPPVLVLAQASHARLHLLRAWEAYLITVARPLRRAGFWVVSHLAQGCVADAILAYADAIQADLVAMATHGRSGLSRWLLGSVADEVMRHAHVPILLLHPLAMPCRKPRRGR